MRYELSKQEVFENVEVFVDFLKRVVKRNISNIEDTKLYLEELLLQYSVNGFANYEISPFETKSGNPECISYEVIYDGDLTTVIF